MPPRPPPSHADPCPRCWGRLAHNQDPEAPGLRCLNCGNVIYLDVPEPEPPRGASGRPRRRRRQQG